MKQVLLILLLAAGSMTGFAQQDSTIVRRDTIPEQADTIRVGGIIIIKKQGDNSSYDVQKAEKYYPNRRYKKSKITTNWLIMDVGFSGYNDRTNYATQEAQDFLRFQNGVPASKGDYALRGSRISNFNLWFFMQRMSIYKNVVNLKYGFGIETNNYYYKTPITYVDGASPYTFRDSISFDKNKIAADFLTIPLMVNINTNPYGRHGGFQISFGVSGGYMYSSRQKQKSDERGKQKQKTDFNLSNWKAAWVAELGLGPVMIYGSYSITPLHEYGLDQYPFNVGIRLSAMDNW
jgi:hypothetical protein